MPDTPAIPQVQVKPASDPALATPGVETSEGLSDHEKEMIAVAEADAFAGPTPETPADGVEPSPENAGEGNEGDPAPAATKPDNIPDEYWDAEKGVVDVDAMAAALAAKAEPPAEGETPPEGDGEATEGFDWSSLDMNALGVEIVENGSFTEETVTKLSKDLNMPPEIINQFAEGQAALAEKQVNALYEATEGVDNFRGMIQWAGDNISEAEATAINTALNNPGDPQTGIMVKGLYARYQAAEGKSPNLLTGDPSSGSNDTFKSAAEITVAMADPRYATDPSYQQSVYDKMKRSEVQL